MNFASINFYLLLIPATILFILMEKKRLFVILAASLLFYFLASGWQYFLMFLALVTLNYFLIGRPVWVNLLFNFSVLIYFKLKIFHLFLTETGTFNQAGIAGILLPAGISFYTFQLVAYQIDNSRTRKNDSYFEFLSFISFFPQLVAGPIERKDELLPQLKTVSDRSYKFDSSSLLFITWGLFKKLVISERAAILCNVLFNTTIHSPGLVTLLASIFFGIQTYCDFSGYTDIALGLGRLFDINLRDNFLSPYTSPSISVFWRRWHVTLSGWFRDYVYLPLGRTKFSLILVFILSGLWHGSTPLFFIWGIYHASLLIISRSLPKFKWPPLVPAIFTFLLVSLGWIFFRSYHLHQATLMISTIFKPAEGWFNLTSITRILDPIEWIIFISGTIIVLVVDHIRHFKTILISEKLRPFVFFIVLIIIFFFSYPQTRNFIYFHF